MPSPLAQAFEMGWEAAKGWNVGYGHGVQITTNTFTFGMIKPLNESTQQLINQNQHLGYKYAEGAAAVSRTALVTAGTLGIGQAAQAAQAAQCVAGTATYAGRAAQLYNGVMAAHQGYQGCKASREAYDRISKRDYIGGYMKVGEAALNFFGAAQSGRMAVKGPNCFIAGTQVVMRGDDDALPPGNIITAESQNQTIVTSTGESELAAVAVIGVGIALGVAKSQLADEGRSSNLSKRLTVKTRPQQSGPRPIDLPDEPRKVYDHHPDPIRAVLPSEPQPLAAKPEETKPKTMKPKRHWLSKTLTAAMLLSFSLGGWLVSQSMLRTSDQAQASSSVGGSLPTEPQYVTKNIEDIEEGDVVLGRDENGDEIGYRKVVAVYRRTSDHLRHLRFRSESGQIQSLSTTDEHPFWDADAYKFINAGDLAEYTKVTGPNGEQQTLVSTTRTEHPEGIPVFNFTVEGYHTYFVAQRGEHASILVHNANQPVYSGTTPTPVPTQTSLTGAAQRANATAGTGSGAVHGTKVHSAFETEVKRLGKNLTTEISYKNGVIVKRGTGGSVRLDVVEGPQTAPIGVFDLKTGSATLSQARIRQIQQHVPGGTSVPVIEIR